MKIEQFVKNSPFWSSIYRLLRYGRCDTMDKWPSKTLKKANMTHFKKVMGYNFDLYNPVTFSEKIQWYKLFFKHPDVHRITDKVTFKDYIEEKLGEGYTAKLYGAWDNLESLEKDWDNLPEQFVIKANLFSDDKGVLVVKHKSKVSFWKAKKQFRDWLDVKKTLMNSTSRNLYWSKPMILAEELLDDGTVRLTDYKFFCFDGVPMFLYIDINHSIIFYDMDWRKLNVKYGKYNNESECSCPRNFEEMKSFAAKLSKGFPFVRVDLYNTYKGVFVGEMTFDPGGGLIHYYPKSFNEEMGRHFVLPK